MIRPLVGVPGMGSLLTASHRNVFKSKYGEMYLPGGSALKGSKCADPGNTGDTRKLRAGTLVGRISSTVTWANTILGLTTVAYTSGGTTLNVSAAQAAEIVRRIGTSGSMKCVGPPSAAGTVAVTSVTFSAVNTGTGDVTVTSLGVNKIAGSWLTDTDGSETPRLFLPDGFPLRVTDDDGTAYDVDFPMMPVGGIIDASQIINWPSDTSLQQYVVDQVGASGYGNYTWDHLYGY